MANQELERKGLIIAVLGLVSCFVDILAINTIPQPQQLIIFALGILSSIEGWWVRFSA